jgi:hypothetical protein|tara:strand:+ start:111 stop:1040 length:930 start_codon:yes stop_codon:yes gene_type:complete
VLNKKDFYLDGYSLCQGVLSDSVVGALRSELSEYSRLGRNPYIYESEIIQSVVFGSAVQNLATQILGKKYIFLPDYSLNAVDFWSAFGWHKDSVDRYDINGADWDDPNFPIIRFGIYLGDYSSKTGSLGIQKASNKGPLYANAGINVKSKPGDVVIWPLTTTHTANSPSFKFSPNSALSPPINTKIVRALTNKLGILANRTEIGLQENLPNRQVLFFSVAKPGPHLARYMSYLVHREYFRDFIRKDPEQGEMHSRSSDYSAVNWLQVKSLMEMADKKLISKDFNQKTAQAASEVLFSEFTEVFKHVAPS